MAAPGVSGLPKGVSLPARGVCVVLGGADGESALSVARREGLQVYTQLPDGTVVDRVRRKAAAAGLDAARFQIDEGGLGRLHLADNVADVVYAAGGVKGLTLGEALRVVRPGGKVWLAGRVHAKPVPAHRDDWSHPYHGPDNNPLSDDPSMRFPYMTQFLAGPHHGPAPQCAVAAGGRVFKAFGHVAWHAREEPLLNTLLAFNGYNGTILWKRKLRPGTMVHRNTMVATPGTLYLGDDRSCKLLDAATGELQREFEPAVDVAGGTFWKWMALADGRLYALTGEQEQKDPEQRWKRTQHGWPWNAISKGFTQPDQPWGFGRCLLALDPADGKVLWHHREDEPVDSRALCMAAGRLFAFRFNAYLVCIDAATGRILWRKTPQNASELFRVLGRCMPRQGWSTNWRTTAYLKCSDRALYFAGPQVNGLVAVSAEDGRLLWRETYNNFQLVIHPDGLYGIGGPWGKKHCRKFDPLTGEVLAELSAGRRACTRPTATVDSILFRAMGGSVRLDLADGKPRYISPMRPPCQDGVTIANGHLYWWPYACDCQLTLYGVTCLRPVGDWSVDGPAIGRLRMGSDSRPSEPSASSEADWPTFRANNRRSAVSTAVVPEAVEELWRVPAASPLRLTPPVAAGGRVFVAGDDGSVRAFDAATGRPSWQAYTGGEVPISPTVWKGRVFTGSGDGWVYCHDAASGRLLWRFRAAPVERKIPVYGKLQSTWPAASGVLVDRGVAYVAAGRANYDGTYVYALDAATGAVKWVNDTSGHLDKAARCGVSVQGHLLLNGGKLYLAGGNAVSPAVYDIRDGRCLNAPGALAACQSTSPRGWELSLVGTRVIAFGRPFTVAPDVPVYDHTVFKTVFHASNGRTDIVWRDGRHVSCFDPIGSGALSKCVTDTRAPRHITQAWGRFKVANAPRWERDLPESQAVALAANAVVVAAASTLKAFDPASGGEFWSKPLPASPVPRGLAVDREGRVVVSLVDGSVTCFGAL